MATAEERPEPLAKPAPAGRYRPHGCGGGAGRGDAGRRRGGAVGPGGSPRREGKAARGVVGRRATRVRSDVGAGRRPLPRGAHGAGRAGRRRGRGLGGGASYSGSGRGAGRGGEGRCGRAGAPGASAAARARRTEAAPGLRGPPGSTPRAAPALTPGAAGPARTWRADAGAGGRREGGPGGADQRGLHPEAGVGTGRRLCGATPRSRPGAAAGANGARGSRRTASPCAAVPGRPRAPPTEPAGPRGRKKTGSSNGAKGDCPHLSRPRPDQPRRASAGPGGPRGRSRRPRAALGARLHRRARPWFPGVSDRTFRSDGRLWWSQGTAPPPTPVRRGAARAARPGSRHTTAARPAEEALGVPRCRRSSPQHGPGSP